MYDNYVPATNSTWDTKEQYSKYQKNASPTNSTTQTRDQRRNQEAPTEPQKPQILYSITQRQHHSLIARIQQFPHYNNTYNTIPPKRTLLMMLSWVKNPSPCCCPSEDENLLRSLNTPKYSSRGKGITVERFAKQKASLWLVKCPLKSFI